MVSAILPMSVVSFANGLLTGIGAQMNFDVIEGVPVGRLFTVLKRLSTFP